MMEDMNYGRRTARAHRVRVIACSNNMPDTACVPVGWRMDELVAERRRIREECFADDIDELDAETYTAAQIESFYQSGGHKPSLPPPPVPPPVPPPPLPPSSSSVAALAGITLVAAGSSRFTSVPPRVFVTSGGCRIVYQLSPGARTPIVILGGGNTGRAEACHAYGAESPAFQAHTVLIFDRRNTGGGSDVCFAGIGGERAENHQQRDDLAELLEGLSLPPAILLGHSSGARLFCMLALARPELVRALCLGVLTGGHKAASQLSRSYYLRHAKHASESGMERVLSDSYFKAASLNARVAPYLRGLTTETFAEAMRASAALYAQTSDEPALGLPAAELATLLRPALVFNHFGKPSDGMHLPEVTLKVAAALPQAEKPIVCEPAERDVWFEAIVRFVGVHGIVDS